MSWTVVWRAVSPEVTVPYAPAIVALDEGYETLTSIVGCDHADLRAGLRVEVVSPADGRGSRVPYFRLAASDVQMTQQQIGGTR